MTIETRCTLRAFDSAALNNYGSDALMRGDLHTAMAAFAVSGIIALARSSRSDSVFEYAGTTLWLANERYLASHLWLQAVEEHIRGRITHSDLPGGIGVGLLLWFAWRRTGEEHFANRA